MSNALLFVALCLASYRVWRLIARDDITQPIRNFLFVNENGEIKHEWVAKLVTCEWCCGSYLSVAVVYATHRWLVPLAPHWLLWAVAVSCVVGLIGKLDD